jgi:hypothetical protein
MSSSLSGFRDYLGLKGKIISKTKVTVPVKEDPQENPAQASERVKIVLTKYNINVIY